MRRREFIGLLGGVAGALTCADAFAAQKSPIARIGFLGISPFGCESFQQDSCWIGSDLRALGWLEGKNLHVESRFADHDPAKLPALAAELVSLRPDVLFASAQAKPKP
jgi:hypothetical protein